MTTPKEPCFVYVSGPYTKGDVAQNVRAAIDAAEELRNMGYVPFIPHMSHFWHMVHPRPYEDWMEMDLARIAKCDILVRLPGDSAGADREEAEATRLGIPISYGVQPLKNFRGYGIKPLDVPPEEESA